MSTAGTAGAAPHGVVRPDSRAAVRAALGLLHRASGLAFAGVAAVSGTRWTLVEAIGETYPLQPGRTMPWDETLCWQTVLGSAPRLAPSVAAVPALAAAPMCRELPVGAYAGAPLVHEGAVVGTILLLDPASRDGFPDALAPTLDAVATLLGTVVGLDRLTLEMAHRVRGAEAEAQLDHLTQLGNRLAWSKVLAEEEARYRRYGGSAAVVSVDLDGLKAANDAGGHAAGDLLLQRAADVLRRTSRLSDHVARVGGDEFAVLVVEAGEDDASAFAERLRVAFRRAGVEASVGVAGRDRHGDLESAWRAADVAMYADKRRRMQDRIIRALVDPDAVPRPRASIDLTDADRRRAAEPESGARRQG